MIVLVLVNNFLDYMNCFRIAGTAWIFPYSSVHEEHLEERVGRPISN